MVMDMEEGQARTTFHKLAESLWLIGSRGQKQQEGVAVAPVQESTETVYPGQERQEVETVVEAAGIPEKEGGEPAPNIISAGYGGYLYMKCPACGKTRGFCAKTRLNHYRCECGAVTRMERMVPLYMKCECGRQARYLTNMTETEFDVDCYDCGAPVTVSWNVIVRSGARSIWKSQRQSRIVRRWKPRMCNRRKQPSLPRRNVFWTSISITCPSRVCRLPMTGT